jgi:hypothetical protein
VEPSQALRREIQLGLVKAILSTEGGQFTVTLTNAATGAQIGQVLVVEGEARRREVVSKLKTLQAKAAPLPAPPDAPTAPPPDPEPPSAPPVTPPPPAAVPAGLLNDVCRESARLAAGVEAKYAGSPDLWTEKQRTYANLCAMHVLAAHVDGSPATQAEIEAAKRYSGWGGLSIAENVGRFPSGIPAPSSQGLIHEYYTPSVVGRSIADAVRSLLPTIPKDAGSGKVVALEPSAGIGRLVRPFLEGPDAEAYDWTAVELSQTSAMLLRLTLPQLNVENSMFEKWIAEKAWSYDGRLGLIVSNPPYGERGAGDAIDQHPLSKKEGRAYRYFIMRCLSILATRGLGVFLVPSGFLSGKGARVTKFRHEVMRRAHLSIAFRMPSEAAKGDQGPGANFFPGAKLVTDLLFLRSRGGDVGATQPADQFILDGDYFEKFPEYILGTPVKKVGDSDDDQTENPRYGYQVRGRFTGLPKIGEGTALERPLDDRHTVEHKTETNNPNKAARKRRGIGGGTKWQTDPIAHVSWARVLGRRIQSFRGALATDAATAQSMWTELAADVREWRMTWGDPRSNYELNAVDRDEQIEAFLSAFDDAGSPTLEFIEAPTVNVAVAHAGDPAELAASVYAAKREVTLSSLIEAAARVRGDDAREWIYASLPALYEAGWRLNRLYHGAQETLVLEREADYFSGSLWPTHDAAVLLARDAEDGLIGGVQGMVYGHLPVAHIHRQIARLRTTMNLADYQEIAGEERLTVLEGGGTETTYTGLISPTFSWVPMNLIEAWLSSQGYRFDGLVRHEGLVTLQLNGAPVPWATFSAQFKASSGTKLADRVRRIMYLYGREDAAIVLGYLNNDWTIMDMDDWQKTSAERSRGASPEDVRRRQSEAWETSFRKFVAGSQANRDAIVNAYNRSLRGFVQPSFSGDPIVLHRWGSENSKDVRLKQHQIRATRRVAHNRGGLLAFDVGVGKTFTGIACIALARQMGWSRRPVVLVPNTIIWNWVSEFQKAMGDDFRLCVIGAGRKILGGRGKRAGMEVSATDTPDERALKWKQFRSGHYDCALVTYSVFDRTEIDAEKLESYVRDTPSIMSHIGIQERKGGGGSKADDKPLSERELAIKDQRIARFVHRIITPSENERQDPDILWDDIGVDFLVVDEAQNFKNLYTPEKGFRAAVPKYMGGEGSDSNRAWQLDLRMAAVRRKNEGAGVLLLSATPAKNSPLEFYSMLQYVDHDVWTRMGIYDVRQFQDHFMIIQNMKAMNASLNVVETDGAKGFKNLDLLRDVVFRLGEFKTAADVGIQLPEPTVQFIGDGGMVYRTEKLADGSAIYRDGNGAVVDISDVGVTLNAEQELLVDHYVKQMEGTNTAEIESLMIFLRGLERRMNDPNIPLTPQEAAEALQRLQGMNRRGEYILNLAGDTIQNEEGGMVQLSPLGVIGRLNGIAVHPKLDTHYETTPIQAYDWGNAAKLTDYHSPKIDACVASITRKMACGQCVIVAEDDQAHMIELLSDAGVDDDKILRLTESNLDKLNRFHTGRIRSADEYEVVVTTQAIYDKTDLASRTCGLRIADKYPRGDWMREVASAVCIARTCGHIIFTDFVAAHVWTKMALVAAGVPEARIAILNAEATKDTLARQKIAEGFNGDRDDLIEPAYDVVIANAVAYEGINLQGRTCAIHHLDLPWEPASLQQRNGRGVRQGNVMPTVEINYYFAKKSADGLRFITISSKLGWMADLVNGAARETNNPGAQLVMTEDQLTEMISRNPEKRRILNRLNNLVSGAEKQRVRIQTNLQILRKANNEFVRARFVDDPASAAAFREKGEQLLQTGLLLKPEEWPFGGVAVKMRDVPVVIPTSEKESPVYEGCTFEARGITAGGGVLFGIVGRASGQFIYVAVNRSQNDREEIVFKAGSSVELYNSLSAVKVIDGPDLGMCDERVKYMIEGIREFYTPMRRGDFWPNVGWRNSPDWFRERYYLPNRAAILSAPHDPNPQSPFKQYVAIHADGTLRLVNRATFTLTQEQSGEFRVCDPTNEGWAAMLAAAELTPSQKEGVQHTPLNAACMVWWGKEMPTGVLGSKYVKPAKPAKAEGGEPPPTTPAV